MMITRMLAAYLAAAVVTFTLASAFYTQQDIARQPPIFTREQEIQQYIANFFGLAPSYGVVLAIALLIGFLIAVPVKRVLTPLARVAYPIAGASAVLVAIWFIENIMAAGGAGALNGVRGFTGHALQGAAGFAGGVIFAVLRGR